MLNQPGTVSGIPRDSISEDFALEQSDEWATRRARYMTLETISAISDTTTVSLPAVAA